MSDCKITINGKPYRCAFTMLQMEQMSKLTEKQDTNTAIGACLPFTAIQMAAKQDRVALDITFEDVLVWYDMAITEDSEELKAVLAAFTESTIYKKLSAPAENEEKKSQ